LWMHFVVIYHLSPADWSLCHSRVYTKEEIEILESRDAQ
jgi:hypothetical protein